MNRLGTLLMQLRYDIADQQPTSLPPTPETPIETREQRDEAGATVGETGAKRKEISPIVRDDKRVHVDSQSDTIQSWSE